MRAVADGQHLEGKVKELEEEAGRLRTENHELKMDKLKLESQYKKWKEDREARAKHNLIKVKEVKLAYHQKS